jgi:RimJ/RimL family protein N-acetyltransferase
MNTYPIIVGERVYLRALEPIDLDRCIKWISDAEVTTFLTTRQIFNSIREREWLDKLYTTDNEITFAICVKDGNIHIGNGGLHAIDRFYRCATLGIVIGEKEYWGKGYGTEAVRLLADFAFRTQNLNRLDLVVLDFNERARRCYKKIGFVEEGRLREKCFKNGAYCDEIVMSILQNEWLKNSAGKSDAGNQS